jgi:hypothetical protein
LERLLASQEITFGRHHTELARTLIKIGDAALELKDWAKAESSYFRAMELLIQGPREQPQEVLRCLEQLAAIADAQRNNEQAERLRQEATIVRKKIMEKKLCGTATRVLAPAAMSPPPSAPNTTKPAQAAVAKAAAQPVQPARPAQTGNPSALIVKTSGQRVPLGTGAVWIGQDAMNDVCLPNDSAAARSHAVVERVQDQIVIRLCGDFPTLINGSKFQQKAKLSPGDIITVGRTELQFV